MQPIVDHETVNSTTLQIMNHAHNLAELGMSVFPLPYRSKRPLGYSWKKHAQNRLFPTHARIAWQNNWNIGVMCGSISGNLIVIDAETEVTFIKQLAELVKREIPVYAVQTGGERMGGHIYLRIVEGAAKSISSKRMKDVEIRGEGAYVVGAYSVHPATNRQYLPYLRNTGEYPPVVSIDTLDWLVDNAGMPVKLELVKVATYPLPAYLKHDPRAYGINTETRIYLDRGASEHTRNNSLFNAACELYARDFTVDEISDFAGSVARAGGLEEREVSSSIQSACSKPRQKAREYAALRKGENVTSAKSVDSARQEIAKCASFFAQYYEWNDLTADRKVFDAIVQRLVQHGTYLQDRPDFALVVRATQREVAELAHCERQTVRAAQNRLVDSNILSREHQDEVTGAYWWTLGRAVYELCTAFGTVYEQYTPPSPKPSSYILHRLFGDQEAVEPLPSDMHPYSLNSVRGLKNRASDNLEDLFERGVLGRLGLEVYDHLLVAEMSTITEIAAALKTKKSLVTRLLRNDGVLRQSELVVKYGRKHYFANPVGRDYVTKEVLEPSRKWGKSRRRRKQHEDDRSAYLLASIQNWQKRFLARQGQDQTYEIGAKEILSRPV